MQLYRQQQTILSSMTHVLAWVVAECKVPSFNLGIQHNQSTSLLTTVPRPCCQLCHKLMTQIKNSKYKSEFKITSQCASLLMTVAVMLLLAKYQGEI